MEFPDRQHDYSTWVEDLTLHSGRGNDFAYRVRTKSDAKSFVEDGCEAGTAFIDILMIDDRALVIVLVMIKGRCCLVFNGRKEV